MEISDQIRNRREVKKSSAAPSSLIIAHEIGHLLLGPDSHSAAGIMTARWKSRDLVAICQGGLTFTRQESERIQAEVRKRQAQQALVASAPARVEGADER